MSDTGAVKRCTKCGEVKGVGEFSPDTRNADGLYRRCKQCINRQQYQRRYGIKPELALELRDQPCMICGSHADSSTKGFHCIDHDHKTGAVRGVLCYPCNTAVGKLQDSPELLARAIHYLTRGADYRCVDREDD